MAIETFQRDQIKKYVTVFGLLFSGIYINREDSAGDNVDSIKVPIMYGPKDPMLARIQADPNLNRSEAISLPTMSFEYKNLQYDPARKLNTMGQTFYNLANTQQSVIYNPVPYNIFFNLYIYVKNANDGNRIIEQILPNFTPDWTPTVILDPSINLKKDIPIILNTAQPEDSYETAGNMTTRRAIIWTLGFTMKVYFYGPEKTSSIIKFVDVSVNSRSTITDPSTTEKDMNITVQPGLTANGQPTTDPSQSINYKEINVNDNWAFIESYIKS